MLGLKKRTYKGRGERKTIAFDSFGIGQKGTRALKAYNSLNCTCRDGRIRGGIGTRPLTDDFGNKIQVIITSSNSAVYMTTTNTGAVAGGIQIYLLDTSGHLYLRNASTNRAEKKIFLGPGVDYCAFKGENGDIYNLFSGTADVIMTTDGSSFTSKLWDGMRGACVLGKRYVVVKYNGEIRYSAVLDPFAKSSSDADGSGTIYLPMGYGNVVGMKEYGGEGYIFCEKGIFRLSVAADASEFVLKNIPYKGGDICLRAMAISQKGVVFLASEGAYCVKGDLVRRICEHLPIGLCDTEELCATGYGDGFFMFDYMQKTATGTAKRRLVVDSDCEDGFFTDLYGALGENEYTLVVGQVNVFTKDQVNIRRGKLPYFTTEPLDFGTKKSKRLKTLRVRGAGNVNVIVQCDGSTHSYSLDLSGGEMQTRLMGKGKAITITFELQACAVVEGVEIGYTVEG